MEPKTEKKKPKATPEWHAQQEILLKHWSETASCYRWLHNASHLRYKRQNKNFVIPVIIISTITGTLSFAHASFPEDYQPLVPLATGAMNIFAGMVSTIAQFLRVSELMETHRTASLAFGKMSRDIRIELSLPHKERSMHGRDFLKQCRAEMNRLMQQSPAIPPGILINFENEFSEEIARDIFYVPEILDIHPVEVYDNSNEVEEAKVADIVAKAAERFKRPPRRNSFFGMRRRSRSNSSGSTPRAAEIPTKADVKQQIRQELEQLQAAGSVRDRLANWGQPKQPSETSSSTSSDDLSSLDLAAEAEADIGDLDQVL